MVKEFELWLDESGDFDNDEQKVKRGLKPSLIGGVLVEKGKFDKKIDSIISNDSNSFSHATEENAQIQFDKFEKIIENAKPENGFVRFVVFNNEECIMVIDNNITYQNIMAGGIPETIKWLKETYNRDTIKLNVIIANRVNTTNNNQIVEIDEYYNKLRERLIVIGLKDNIIQDKDWGLERKSARKEKKLMIADNICNAFLTRDNKFHDNQSERINSIYNNEDMTLVFPVIQHLITSTFDDLIMEGKIGEAVAVICQHDDTDHIKKCMKKVEKRLVQMNTGDMELHYRFITALIEFYLNGVRNFGLCEKMLNNIIQQFIPLLEKANINSKGILGKSIIQKLSFDLQFYLLTLYTHQGNVYGAQMCIDKCDEIIKLFPKTIDTIIYIVKYEIRKIIAQINIFDFDKALETSKNLVKKCTNIKEAQEIFDEDIKFDELAKALGNEVQIYTFLLRKNKGLYEEAKKASNLAISEFTKDSDIIRQYLYRVNLETEGGNYEQALTYLYEACNIDNKSLKDLANRIVQNRNDYEVCAYVRLMAEGMLGKWTEAEMMFQYIEKTSGIQYIESMNEKRHPHEIILWKYATCFVKHNSVKAGLKKYDEAVDICFSDNDLTINFIGLAIELEKYSVILKKNLQADITSCKKLLEKHYKRVYSNDLPKSMKDMYENINFRCGDWEYYYNLSREVTY